MTRTRGGRFAALALAFAALLGLASVVGATRAQALPLSIPLEVTFRDMMPGESASHTWQVTVPERAVVSEARLEESGPGEATWTTELCPGAGACLDLGTLKVGTPLPAGSYDLRVGVTVHELDPGQTQSIEGRYTLVGAPGDDGLASTGLGAGPLAAAALAFALLGLLLLVVGRRRRTEHDEEPA
ncbi:hypothetical protein [Cellulomonas composti]|uniref:Uncharacterized protein n=1 Tax=Cellulomonas composti TaxID=266130 RepID=A0A511JD22_9CELL|nr:hypothetical protein [Cellulomonas composti]GEL95875.1 hypothetical protein CCO02nite_25330 [Cellulomonas composti]